jgi:hypothetical protein
MPTLANQVAKRMNYKDRAEDAYTGVHQAAAKKGLQNGHVRTYRPYSLDASGNPRPEDTRPEDSQLVQVRCRELLHDTERILVPLIDSELTVDAGNQHASADIVIDGHAIATDVPVTTLIWLANRLSNMQTLLAKFPLVDPAQEWEWDAAGDCWRSAPVVTQATQKVWKALVKHPGTDKHPPQTESYQSDEYVGEWTRVNFSGSMKASEVRELSGRVTKMSQAVEAARQEAAKVQVPDRHIGADIFAYLLPPA